MNWTKADLADLARKRAGRQDEEAKNEVRL